MRERWKTRNGLSFWSERMGETPRVWLAGTPAAVTVVVVVGASVLAGRSLVMRVGAATSFLRRFHRGRCDMARMGVRWQRGVVGRIGRRIG
jgi:hypothetical protein